MTEKENDALWERIEILINAYSEPQMLIDEEDAKTIDKLIEESEE